MQFNTTSIIINCFNYYVRTVPYTHVDKQIHDSHNNISHPCLSSSDFLLIFVCLDCQKSPHESTLHRKDDNQDHM